MAKGPHISSLCVLPAALAASFLALGNGGPSRWRRRGLSARLWSQTISMGRRRSRFCIRSWSGPSGLANGPGRLVTGGRDSPACLWFIGVLADAFLREDHPDGSEMGISAGQQLSRIVLLIAVALYCLFSLCGGEPEAGARMARLRFRRRSDTQRHGSSDSTFSASGSQASPTAPA